MYITDELGDEYKKWGQIGVEVDPFLGVECVDNVVFLKAPTGTGKTTFMLWVFADYIVSEKGGKCSDFGAKKYFGSAASSNLHGFFCNEERVFGGCAEYSGYDLPNPRKHAD